MTGKLEFAFFRSLGRVGLFLSITQVFIQSCSTPPHPKPEVTPTLEAPPLVSLPKAFLSKLEVEAGSAIWLRVTLPPEFSEDYPAEKIDASFEGISLPFYRVASLSRVYETLIGIPFGRKPGQASLFIQFKKSGSKAVLDDSAELTVSFAVIAGKYRSEVLHVDGKRVHPREKKDLVRILKEQGEISHIYRKVTREQFWTQGFQMPIESIVTSPFGTKRIYNGELKSYHTGLDLRAAIGTPIFSSEAGRIVMAKELFYTGNTILLDHGYGIITLYAHMSVLNVKVGQMVGAHELLGLSGKTGRVNGPHLHWQAVVHGVKVNPLALLASVETNADG